MSDNTRDWLLKKLLSADRVIVQQRVDINDLRAQAQGLTADLIHARREHAEDTAHLHARIQQMAPEKQFDVQWNGPGRVSLEIDSISSANGKTTIHVQRARSPG